MNNRANMNGAVPAPPGAAGQGFGMLSFGYLGQPINADNFSASPAFPASMTMSSGPSMSTDSGNTTFGIRQAASHPAQISLFQPSMPHQLMNQNMPAPLHPHHNNSASGGGAQPNAATTPFLPQQLLLNAGNNWALSAASTAMAAAANPSSAVFSFTSTGIPVSSSTFPLQHSQQQQQQHQNADNHFISQIPPLPAHTLQNSGLMALQGMGPHQTNYMIMMQQLQQQQQQQQPQKNNVAVATSTKNNNSSASILSPSTHQQSQAPSVSRSDQTKPTAMAGAAAVASASATTPALSQKSMPPPPSLPQPLQAAASHQPAKKPQQLSPPTQRETLASASTAASAPAQQQNSRAQSMDSTMVLASGVVSDYASAVVGDGVSYTAVGSTISTSPALSTATRKSKTSPKPSKRTQKEPKRKNAPGAKKDGQSVNKQKPDIPPAVKKARSAITMPPHQPAALPLSISTAVPMLDINNASLPSAPLLSASMPSLPQDAAAAAGEQLQQHRIARVTTIAGTEVDNAHASTKTTLGQHQATLMKINQRPSQRPVTSSNARGEGATSASMPSVSLSKSLSFQKTLPSLQQKQQQQQQDEVLGQGTGRLLAFHSKLAPSTAMRSLDYWNEAISANFADGGTIRMDLGGQSYDMPVATAGRFYYRLFSDGSVVSMHVALSAAKVHHLANSSSIVSFHSILLTTTYANGRRVLEAGDLRVIFDSQFRIRVWAFTSNDATVCLPRKRPNGPEDALMRTNDATIARNLDWPNESPAPKRRKSAHGKQPPDECHLEIANTMTQVQSSDATSSGIPLPVKQQKQKSRPRKKSIAVANISEAADTAQAVASLISAAAPNSSGNKKPRASQLHAQQPQQQQQLQLAKQN
ncbi:LIM-domain binding protein-domain-containing protein [Coemansia spiralis]|nr:LIM-domain binding protein-domain-containing protein [Coemansia spiralis]